MSPRLELGRPFRPRGDDRPQAVKPGRRNLLFRRLHQRREHRRDDIEPGHVVARDRAQRLSRVERRQQMHRRADEEAVHRCIEEERVGQRPRDEKTVAGIDAELDLRGGEAPDPGAVGAQEGLRLPCRARGEADIEGSLGIDGAAPGRVAAFALES